MIRASTDYSLAKGLEVTREPHSNIAYIDTAPSANGYLAKRPVRKALLGTSLNNGILSLSCWAVLSAIVALRRARFGPYWYTPEPGVCVCFNSASSGCQVAIGALPASARLSQPCLIGQSCSVS